MKFKNKFAEEEYNQSITLNSKTRKFPELLDLHRRWYELLNDENTIFLISDHDFSKRYDFISNIIYKNKEYQIFKSIMNEKKYIIGSFTEENEFDENKKRFQVVWTN